MRDRFSQKARREGYKAHSAYKLIDLNNKYGFLKNKCKVLDLGCSPGSWSQVAKNLVGEQGLVVGVDKNRMNVDVEFVRKDVFADDLLKKLDKYGKFDIVLSDLSPYTTGDKDLDGMRSEELCLKVKAISEGVLKKGGWCVCKFFQSGSDIIKDFKSVFKTVKSVKPVASKMKSREMYLVCSQFLGQNKSYKP
jgi:23S rRNA (uridine2552-2'-O)-methyltransferase